MFSALPSLAGRDVASIVLAFAALVPLVFAAYGAALLLRAGKDAQRHEAALRLIGGAIAAAVVAALVFAVTLAAMRGLTR